MNERKGGFSVGVVPVFVENLDGGLSSVDRLVEKYKQNGYDYGRVAENSYLLAERRRLSGDPQGFDGDKNWADGERLIAIQDSLNGRLNDE